MQTRQRARTWRALRGSRAPRATSRRCDAIELLVVHVEPERSRVDIDRDEVCVADEGDRASTHRLGRDVADHQPTCRAAETSVGDEHDRLAEAAPDDRRGDRQHFRHSGAPAGPSLRTTITSPGCATPPWTPALHASSESNTRAGPRWNGGSWPASLTTAPSGARLPRSTRNAPPGLNGVTTAATTSPSGSLAPAACSASVRPSTVGARREDARATASRPRQCRRPGAGRPRRSGRRGQIRHDRRRRGQAVEVLESGSIPASLAIASKWSTAFVDPPVPVTPTIAFSSEARVTSADGRRSRPITSSTSRPAASAASPFAGSAAGTLPRPIGPTPRNRLRPPSCSP